MPKAWESHLLYFSNEFQVCDPRRSNRKCVCDVCVCEWGTRPLKRTQQWCWFIMRAWENVFSGTFLSTSTNAWSWAFCLNQKCNEGGPNVFLLKLLEILCILCGIGSLWKILRTIMLPELSFRQNAWFLSWFSVTESQSHPQNGHLLFENVVFCMDWTKTWFNLFKRCCFILRVKRTEAWIVITLCRWRTTRYCQSPWQHFSPIRYQAGMPHNRK